MRLGEAEWAVLQERCRHLTTFVLKCQMLNCRWLCLWSTQGNGEEGVPVWVGEDRGTEALVFAHTEVLVGGIWNLKCNKLYIRSFLHVQIRS